MTRLAFSHCQGGWIGLVTYRADSFTHGFKRDRLLQVTVNAQLQANRRVDLLAVAGTENNRRIGSDGQNFLDQFLSCHIRHSQVGDNNVEIIRLVTKYVDRIQTAVGIHDPITELFKELTIPTGDRFLVVNEEDLFRTALSNHRFCIFSCRDRCDQG